MATIVRHERHWKMAVEAAKKQGLHENEEYVLAIYNKMNAPKKRK